MISDMKIGKVFLSSERKHNSSKAGLKQDAVHIGLKSHPHGDQINIVREKISQSAILQTLLSTEIG